MREAEKAKLLGRDSEGEEEKAPGRENLEEEEEEDGGVEKSAGLRRVRPLISRLTLRRKQRSCTCGGGKRRRWAEERCRWRRTGYSELKKGVARGVWKGQRWREDERGS